MKVMIINPRLDAYYVCISTRTRSTKTLDALDWDDALDVSKHNPVSCKQYYNTNGTVSNNNGIII